jgi:lipopolysaccharide biosynthesis glycosyltransferase
MRKTVIPVFFTIDDNYAYWLAVAANSLIKNASKDYDYRLIILHDGLKEENIRRIRLLERPGFRFEFHTMKESYEGISEDFIGNKLRADYFTLTIYFRLFIADMFPQYDKAIYIDSDVVVPGDISEMFSIELGDNLVAACPDYSIQDIPPLVSYTVHAVGADTSMKYVNSGVLLMNLKELRRVHFADHFLYLLNKYHFDCIAPDQDYLNSMCKGRIHFLGPEWDAMPNNNHPALENPKLIHYNLFEKPWMYDGIQYEEYFWEYAADSGFIDEIKDFKENYSDEQKESDKRCLEFLVRRGGMIAESKEETMKKVFESRREQRVPAQKKYRRTSALQVMNAAQL